MVYMTTLPGGWIADRLIGPQRAVLYGGILIASGHFSMAIPSLTTFYLGLFLIVIGTGLLKGNVSVIVGRLYSAEDIRRDAGYSIFYMGINTGAFVAPLVCGYLGQRVSWHVGFAAAGIGMVLGLIQYAFGRKYLGDAGRYPADAGSPEARARQTRQALTWTIGVVAVLALGALGMYTGVIPLTPTQLSDIAGYFLLVLTVVFFGWLFLSPGWTPRERKQLYVVGVLFLAAALFWSQFEQAGSTLNLFADRNTENSVGGWEFPSSWYQSLNALFIIALAPVAAWLWVWLARRRMEPSSPAKFGIGLTLVGAGFGALVFGAMLAESGVKVSPMWLVLVYFLHTCGELALSPVGLSAMSKLAPVRIGGLIMGVWFLASSVGNYIGGRMAGFYEAMTLPSLFGAVAAFGIAAGLLLLIFSRPMKRLEENPVTAPRRDGTREVPGEA
jgi:POT family proton-dependent oligopeptide transporter